MIDAIQISTRQNSNGRHYSAVDLWIAGMPFTADLMGDIMERKLERIATSSGIEIQDNRNIVAQNPVDMQSAGV